MRGAGVRGRAAMEGRLAGPWSASSESVTLSTRVVTVSASTGASAIASTWVPVYRTHGSGASRSTATTPFDESEQVAHYRPADAVRQVRAVRAPRVEDRVLES